MLRLRGHHDAVRRMRAPFLSGGHLFDRLRPGAEVGPAPHQLSVYLAGLLPILRPLLKNFPNNLPEDQSRFGLVLSGHLID